jgi:hypothetical protein
MTLFLIYADEDREIADEIAGWFAAHSDVEVYLAQDLREQGESFIEQLREWIWAEETEGLLLLMSPHFLASLECRVARDLAIEREFELQAIGRSDVFIRVAKIAETRPSATDFLQIFPQTREGWIDLTDQRTRESTLVTFSDRLAQGRHETSGSTVSNTGAAVNKLPPFRNRKEELERVVSQLTNVSGPHFWHVVAPPALGKSWFLYKLMVDVATAAGAGDPGWVMRLVDVREEPREARSDAAMILARLFHLNPDRPETLKAIASKIVAKGKPFLCLLDSAELLDKRTASELRSYLSQIHKFVTEGGKLGVRLAVVVASRREDDEWLGLTPHPLLTLMPLTEFPVAIVRQALVDLVQKMGARFPEDWFETNAARIHRLSEGLPALLAEYLLEIDRNHFVAMENLESREVFDRLAGPYVEKLLAPESLFPRDDEAQDRSAQGDALRLAFRAVATYRLFTQSTLKHHLVLDTEFREKLASLDWTPSKLWQAIKETALLSRDSREVWEVIHPPIRRLLYRHFYLPDQHDDAHRVARDFYKEWWGDNPVGTGDQVVAMVEWLWHEAVLLRDRLKEMREVFLQTATILFEPFKPIRVYTSTELREVAIKRMTGDKEFREALAVAPGLFEELLDVIRRAEE